ncbi:MAG: NAD(P)-dependent oxidoreductase [Sediminibacterium sp.]
MGKRILFLETVHPVLAEKLNDLGFECEFNYSISYDELLHCISQYNGIVLRSRISFEEQLIQAGSNLEFIARSGSGLEIIDFESCEKHNVKVFSSPEGNSDAVGEHVVGMLLALANNIHLANASVRRKEWLREEHRGFEIKGKTIALIGYGHMGQSVAKKLSGFESNVIEFDKYTERSFGSNAKRVSLEEIYETADIVSLHLPLSEETKEYANEAFFNSFKKSVVFINTSRGGHVNITDLMAALDLGKVSAAALDVLPFEKSSLEGLNENHLFEKLLTYPNVLITPHVAGWSNESYYKLSSVLFEKIKVHYGL